MKNKSKNCICSNRISLEFGPKGGLIKLIDIKTGRNYIAPLKTLPIGLSGKRVFCDDRPLFKLYLVEIDNKKALPWEICLSSIDARDLTVKKHKKRELYFYFHKIDEMDIDVECKIKIDKNPSLCNFYVSIKNKTNLAIRKIEYPVIEIPLQTGEIVDDERFLVSHCDGFLAKNPSIASWNNYKGFYPGFLPYYACLSTQLTAYYDKKSGLYVATHDGDGHVKQLGPKRAGEIVEITPIHHVPEIIGSDVVIPYATVVGTFHGDWQAAADIYKEWAKKQSWCSKKIIERRDIPKWFKKGAFFYIMSLRLHKDKEKFLSKSASLVKKWQKTISMTTIAMMLDWEKFQGWTTPDYFPPYGGTERFKHMCRDMKRLGIRPMIFGISGLKWSLRKNYRKIEYNSWEEFKRKGEKFACVQSNGKLYIHSFQPFLDSEDWNGFTAFICPATPLARSMLYDNAMKLIDLGVVLVQADQVLCGSPGPNCYSRYHGHPPGSGKWQSESIKRIFQEVKIKGKKKNPDFVWLMEEPGEFLIQELDCYHGRNNVQEMWPRLPGTIGVPLFSYLYHEYSAGYGSDTVSVSRENPSYHIYCQGESYINGNFITARCGGGFPIEPKDADPNIVKITKNIIGCIKIGREFLIFGEMLNTPPLEVPEISLVPSVSWSFAIQEGKKIKVPSVLHRSWKSQKGKIAYTLVNISKDKQDFFLDVLPYGIKEQVNLVLFKNGNKSKTVVKNVRLPYTLNLNLDPLDAVILKIE